MFYDSIQLLDGSSLINVVVDSGEAFPGSPNAGELFFKTTDGLLYVYNGTEWQSVGSGSGGSGTFAVTGDVAGTLENSAGTLTLETVNLNVGTYGSTTETPTITVDAKGRITSVSSTALQITSSQLPTIPVAKGGTGQTTAAAAINALVPSQTGNSGKYLATNGTAVRWDFPSGGTVTSVNLSGGTTGLSASGGPVTTSGTLTLSGVLGVSAGGTGQTTIEGAINALLPNQSAQAGKFLITNGSDASWSSDPTVVTSALGYVPVSKNGDSMSGPLILSGAPTVPLGAATKQYVDDVASSLNVHRSCRTSTVAALSATYSNGSSGVGATLTGTEALPVIGATTLSVADRVLVKDQVAGAENGIYVVTSTASPWVLTRATDFDGSFVGEIEAGDTTFIQEGTLAGSQWVQYTAGTIAVGTSNIAWTQFGGPGSYSAGTGIGLASNVISNEGVLSATAGQNISVSQSTGNITVGLTGTIPVANGGTGATTRQAALNALAGGVTSNRVLQGSGADIVLDQIDLSSDTVKSVLPILHGGTGATTATAAINALVPSQTANSGKFLSTDGTNLEWIGIGVTGDGGALQFNNAGQFDGTAQLSYNATDTLYLGAASGTFYLQGKKDLVSLVLKGGKLEGGYVGIDGTPAGKVVIQGGDGAILYIYNNEGQTINSYPSGPGGDVNINGGISTSRHGGSVIISTATTNSLTERFRIDDKGAWSIEGVAGAAGQILVSNGSSSSPSWQTPAFSGTVTSIGISGGTTGLTTSGGPITSSGTVTLGGTLAIANGGTGATTATAAFNALAPSQTGNSGKFLITDGTTTSWVAATGNGTVTSVALDAGTTGLTVTGGPITLSGTLTLGGTLAFSNGGTGATSRQDALNALAGGVSSGVLRANGTNITLSSVVLTTDVTGILPITNGGTGAATAATALNALAPSQAGNNGKFLKSNGTSISWSAIDTVAAAGATGEIQFNDGGVISATAAVKIVSDVFTTTQNASINGISVGIGPGTGPLDASYNPTYNYNTAIGVEALVGSNRSTYNTGVGYHALTSIVNSSYNTAVGASSLESTTNGESNTGLGYKTLAANTNGSNNVAVGTNALSISTIAGNNVAVGSSALKVTTRGTNNTAVGFSALIKNTTGEENTSIGASALNNNIENSYSTAVGSEALYAGYGASNTAVGRRALYGTTAGANNVAVGAGAGSALTNGSNNTIIGTHAGEEGIGNTVIISAGSAQRIRLNEYGALAFASPSNYGTSGQALISNGSGAAPSWQTPPSGTVTSVAVSGGSTGLTTSGGPITTGGTITLAGTLAIANGGTGATTTAAAFNALAPSQAGNSGKYLTSDGTSTSWAAVVGGTLSNSTIIGTTNAAISLTGKSSATYADAPMTISAGSGANTGNSLTVSGGTGGPQGGGSLVLCAGTGYYLSSGTAGTVTVHADNVTGTGGATEVRGGDGSNGGGALVLRGGDSSYNSASSNGAVSIRGGNGAGTTTGGSVTISGGTGGTAGGALVFKTAATTSLTEKFRILANGAWSVGTDGTSYGTSGQVLTSNGNAAPTWQAVPSSLPAQTSNSGKYLTTDGTSASWSTVSAGSSFTGGTVANATTFSSAVSFGANYDEGVTAISSTSSTTVNCALGNNFEITLANSITSLAFSGIPSSGRLYFCTLILVQDATGSKTVTWPASIRWQGGSAPTLTTTANKIDLITLFTYNGGTTWMGMVAGQNF